MTSISRTLAGILLLVCTSLLLHGCDGLKTGSDEGEGNATQPTEPPIDPNTPATRLQLQGLLPGTALTLQRANQADSAITLDQNGDVNLTGTSLQGITVGELQLLATNTQANQGASHRIQRCKPEIADGDNARLRILCRESLFFVPIDNHQLWISDGTAAGTQLIAVPGNQQLGSNIKLLAIKGNSLFFRATDESHGPELWISDGTAAGTRMFMDFNKNNDNPDINRKGSTISGFIAGDWLFIGARPLDGSTTTQSWITDGTITRQVSLVSASEGSREMGGDMYYAKASDPMALYTTMELWKADGITGQAEKLMDIADRQPGDPSYINYNGDLMSAGKRLYFTRLNPVDRTKELWYLEKNQSAVKVLEIENWIRQHFNEDDLQVAYNLSHVATLDDITYFSIDLKRKNSVLIAAIDLQTGKRISLDDYGALSGSESGRYVGQQVVRQFWRTDGTAQGTAPITSWNPDPELYYSSSFSSGIVRNDKIHLNRYAFNSLAPIKTPPTQGSGNRYIEAGLDIYDPRTDQFTKFDVGTGGLTGATWEALAGDTFYFTAHLNRKDLTLYATDGTEAGTQPIQRKGTYPGSLYSLSTPLVPAKVIGTVNSQALVSAYFRADGEAVTKTTYWITDGTPDNTLLLAIPNVDQIDHL